jgi:hypothetical protein
MMLVYDDNAQGQLDDVFFHQRMVSSYGKSSILILPMLMPKKCEIGANNAFLRDINSLIISSMAWCGPILLSFESVCHAIDTVMNDPAMRENAAVLDRRLRKENGTSNAVAFITQWMNDT